jgi:replicative DNA helicase
MEKQQNKEQQELKERYKFDFTGFESMEQTIEIAKNYIDESRAGKRIVFSTGWERLDRQLMGGLQPGKMYTIGGRPGSGKSQFSNQLLFNVLDQAKRKLVVFYWSFEMPGYQQLMRIVSGDLNTGVYDMIQESASIEYKHILDKFKKYPIFFYNIPNTTVFFKGKINQFCSANPDVTLINIIDHTRLFTGAGSKEEMQRITDVSKTCMETQAKHQTITVLLSQLNRNIESSERANNQYQPLLSDIFGADAIGQDSHVVMMINRPFDMYGIQEHYCNENPRGLMAVHIEKNREGELGMIPFQTYYPSFKLTERQKE